MTGELNRLSIKFTLIQLFLLRDHFCCVADLIGNDRKCGIAWEFAHLEIVVIHKLSEMLIVMGDVVCKRGKVECLEKVRMLDKQLYFIGKFWISSSVVSRDEWLRDVWSWNGLVLVDHSFNKC